MSSPSARALVIAVVCAILAGTSAARAAEPQLYPTGPKNGAAYIRFVNTAGEPLSITSRLARIDLPASGSRRATEFRAVVPEDNLAASSQEGGRTKMINLMLARNELVTVAIGGSASGGPEAVVFRETPTDFNALKVSIALFNADSHCANGQLAAGKQNTPIISGVRPGALGRRSINPINVAISGNCGDTSETQLPVNLGELEAGERYSVFIFDDGNGVPQFLGIHDEIGSSGP